MKALHGKRAWDFIAGDSLWARYARSRFHIGTPGSPLWNALSKILTEVREAGTWRFGNGDTLGSTVCEFYGIPAPIDIRNTRLRDIIVSPDQLDSLVLAAPSRESAMLRNIVLSEQGDRFVCSLTPDGSFTTKEFYKYLQSKVVFPPRVACDWGRAIWRSWVPPKISCFVWKLFHKVVPTDDTIRRIHIPITSRCRCCLSPDMETSDHLFFHSEEAVKVWSKVGSIFDKARPRGIASLSKYWLEGKKLDFLSSLAAGMASCIIWELWMFRNDCMFRNTRRKVWEKCLIWAARMQCCISASYKPSFHADSVLAALRLRPPSSWSAATIRLPWLAWKPPDRGKVLDVAFQEVDVRVRVSGIIRDHLGTFCLGIRRDFIILGRRLAGMVSMLEGLFSDMGSLAADITLVRSSDIAFWDLVCQDDASPNDIYDLRRIRSRYKEIRFQRVSHCQNISPSALLHTADQGVYSLISCLPIPVRRALDSERQFLPSASFVGPISVSDDSRIGNTRYPFIRTHDV